MLDNQLYALARQWLMIEAPKRGLTGPVAYQLRFQPTQQGRNKERTIYMQKVTDRRVGWRTVKYGANGTAPMVRTETQSMETTLQFSVTQPVELDDSGLTHGDVMKLVAASLQGDDAIAWLMERGASVLRVTDIRNSYWSNDRDQNEENPSFDLVLKHNDIYVDGQPYVDRFDFQVVPVPNLA